MVLRLEEWPARPRPPLRLDDPAFRPAVRRWARAVVRELSARIPAHRRVRHVGPRLLALFVDGLPRSVLAAATRDGTMPFLAALRDGPGMREARAFSGMPSSTAAFQAGVFYGARKPDVPAFTWLDRGTGKLVRMNKPLEARAVEARIAGAAAGPGLLDGGAGYLSILRGGAPGHVSTAGIAPVVAREGLPGPSLADLRAWATTHGQNTLPTVARVALEAALSVPDAIGFAARRRTVRHEGNFLLNRVLVGELLLGIARGEVLVDLVRGVPRMFLTLHAYDEVAHRRGPAEATRTLRELDQAIECLCAVAAAVDDPPEPWVFTDHGQIASWPFERLFGCTIEDWLRGARDGAAPPPGPSDEVLRALGARRVPAAPGPLPRAIPAGNYAHVYLGGDAPLDGRAVAERFPHVLARALSCPGVGLVALRTGGGALAFAGGRRVDPAVPGTVPRGASPRAVAALLEDLAGSPSAGDLVLYGSWFDGSCVAFAWEFSSHGGPSPEETETFVLHPAAVPSDTIRIEHGADLHRIFAARYREGTAWHGRWRPS